MQVNTVQDGIAGGAAERLLLAHGLLVDLAVHDDHHDAGDPEGHRGAHHGVHSVHHEHAHLIQRGSTVNG